VVLGRSGEFRIVEEGSNKVIVTNNIPYGSYLYVKDGAKLPKATVFVHGIRTMRLSYLNLQV
jgi:ribosomal protein L30E